MRILELPYIFVPGSKTVTLIDLDVVRPEGLLMIVNIRTNDIIYTISDTALGATFSGNVITLIFDTTAMLSTDPLMIYYEDPYKLDRRSGEDQLFNHIIARRKYIPININAFSSTGGSIWIQGKRILGGILINKPGSAGVLLNVYDDYYTSGGGQRQASIDCSSARPIDCEDACFSTGIFYKMPDPGSGTPPDITFLVG